MIDTPQKLCPCCGRSMEGFAFKGFSYDETLAKCGKVHRVGDMVVNFETLRFTKAGATVKLTKGEWKYLSVLISQSGFPVSRDTLYRIVVGLDGGTTRTIDTFVSMLRHHFGRHIEKIHGIGYRWVDAPKEPVKKEKPVKAKKPAKAKKTSIPRPPKVRVEKVYLHQLNETVLIPTRKIAPVVMDPIPIESGERVYRIRGTHVQWDGKGTPPELIAAYQKARGELPSFITLPLGRIQFQMDGYVATWSGTGAIPDDVLHYLDEHQTLPPMVGKKKRAA